jgi:NAD(P)-dependent dehydrogenase (short-subunit alcohol dehydrogenase family)
MNMKKTVFITGTSSGIGKATVKYFSSKGWNVAATMRTPAKETELQNLPNVKLYALDVTDNTSIETALNNAVADFGSIDVVVNNAGYGVDGIFEAMDDASIQKQYDTNVFGLMRVTRAFIKYFRINNIKGNIVQIASMGGRLAFPLYSIYHGTKWAVEGFSESLKWELEPLGIQVKIVEPGAIKTEFYEGSRKFITPTDTSDYDAFVAIGEKVNMDAGAKGEDPIVIAETIFKAANHRGSKLRFAKGAPAPMLLTMRKYLPDSLWFMVVKASYKL